ncbi:MAG TPA: serine/threonine-protein kinase [Streptosporangiaceae bacterium]|nr:serine/threonine-protein kinase [Streptosporangiaceae bacterium]
MVGVLQPSDPRLIGPYRLIGRLGAGGMGRVFLGVSAAGRPVAVKIVHAGLAADPEFRARFSVEVAAARKVSGLFTALVADADADAPVPWLATAYVAGPSLSEAVRDRGPLSAASLLALAAGLAKSLSAIHAAGVVHGDLKPSNVLLALDGPRVIDFGISQAAEAAPLARSGLVVGTPSFMSPEQAAGQAVGSRSDVFSLGAVLAFAATGRRPFGSGQAAAVLERVVRGAPDLRGTPPEVLPLIERCLAKDPAGRPAAAGLLGEVTAAQAALAPSAPPGDLIPPGEAVPPPGPVPAIAAASRRRRWRRPLVTASAVAGVLVASAAAGYGVNAATGHQAGRSSFSEAAGGPQAGARIDAGDARSARPARTRQAAPPRITGTYTYQQGKTVVFVLYYADPGHDAVGFGFVGVDESDLPRQVLPFSSPGAGVVEAGIISYPLNQGCGTGQEYTSSVKAWIYDKAGARSKPVVIHLACTS